MPAEYYSLTWREFHLMLNGYVRKTQLQYDHTRMICWTIAASNRDPKKPMPPPKRFWPLPIDGNDNTEISDSLQQRLLKASQSLKQRKNGRGS